MRPAVWIAGCAGVVMLSACAVLWPQAAPSPAAQASAPSTAGPQKIVQAAGADRTGPGRATEFVLCSGDACPRVTPKTLAQTDPPHTGAVAQGQGLLHGAPLPQPPTPTEPAAQRVAAPAGTGAGRADASPDPAPAFAPASRMPPGANAVAQAADIAATVRFRFGEAELTDTARVLLDAAVRRAADTGQPRRLRIVGRTDSLGPQAVNDALAMARARAVRDYLRSRLAHWPATVDIEAAGACCYAATNATSEGRLSNRRVEVTLSPSDPEAAL